jgi:tRNA(adenine34) deaminase
MRPPGKNPIGCVIVRDGTVIGEGCNEVDLRHDATAHAEMVSMRRAGQKLQCHELRGGMLYTTLQPCGMCTMASIWAKIGRIVYGAGRDDVSKCISRIASSTPSTSSATRSATT